MTIEPVRTLDIDDVVEPDYVKNEEAIAVPVVLGTLQALLHKLL
jgi:hypothetical protein